MRLPISDQ